MDIAWLQKLVTANQFILVIPEIESSIIIVGLQYIKLSLEVKFHNKWDLLVVFLYIVTCIKQYNTCINTVCTLNWEVWLFYSRSHMESILTKLSVGLHLLS